MIDALRHEWQRLSGRRSTQWLLAVALAVQLATALPLVVLVPFMAEPGASDVVFSWVLTGGAAIGVGVPMLVAYLLGAVGVLAVGKDRRARLGSPVEAFAAIVATTGALAAGFGVVCAGIALAGFNVLGLTLPARPVLVEVAAGVVVYLVLFTWWGVAVAAMVRSRSASLAIMLLVPTVVEWAAKSTIVAIQTAQHQRRETTVTALAKFLPFDAGSQVYTRHSFGEVWERWGMIPFGPLGGAVVMATFVGVLLIWAFAAFLGREA